MKVKRHGLIPGWELDVTCEKCYAVFTLEGAKDMYAEVYPTDKRDGVYVKYGKRYKCICPDCGKKIQIASSDISEEVRSKVKTKK